MFIQGETQLDSEKVREDKPTAQTFLCVWLMPTLCPTCHTPRADALISALHREQEQARDAIDSNSSWHPRVTSL